MSRLFVAVVPPPEVIDLLDELPRDAGAVRWTRRANLHVTLRFLGEADEDEALAALDAVRHDRVIAALGPEVTMLGRGVVIAPVEGLDTLAAAVVERTARIGELPDPRGFRGHLTLGRVRGEAPIPLIGHAVASEFAVEEATLFRSHLRPDGAVHERVGTVELTEDGATS